MWKWLVEDMKIFRSWWACWEVSSSVCRSWSVHCWVNDENLKPKIKHMFLRPCRNTRTYEQLYCVSSNAHQSQYPLSANGSSKCQLGTLLICPPIWMTSPWILVFSILPYIDRHDWAWATQVSNRNSDRRRYIIVAGCRWTSMARELKWFSRNKTGILFVKEWVETSSSVSVQHLCCEHSFSSFVGLWFC